jgi:uncharacterized Tic20 family protein
MGYGTGIILAWFGARQLAADPPEEWQWLVAYRSLILPVTTLILVGLAYHVLLYVSQPFLGKSGKETYNWTFIIGLIVCCGWLILTWLQKCAPQIASAEPRRLRKAA